MARIRKYILVLASLLAAGAGSEAWASTALSSPYYISYNVNGLQYQVDNIVLFEQTANSSGLTWAFSAPAGSSTITDPFTKYDPITSTFLMGTASNLPGDPPGQDHLVLFTSSTFAQSAQNIAFGTLFPDVLETTFVSTLRDYFRSGPGGLPPSDPQYNFLFGFASEYGTASPIEGQSPIAFDPGGTFQAIAFSNGQVISDPGTVTLTAAVPEPSTWAMLLLGFAGLGMLAVRRKTAPSCCVA
ncbi:PEP-CTERM sorting domain-containing protein [Bradyrhizobium campsiandrae]|uniref:PEP-CTERM sorting domain-containing protein n=1 Tax=Bradyrhizobium campsiandrae TaxID=1729892 RepID=UPI001932D64E|nr:PEP-CTERM sorting domain-containing protein [Bradyrhizobium campsiandrae]